MSVRMSVTKGIKERGKVVDAEEGARMSVTKGVTLRFQGFPEERLSLVQFPLSVK